MAAYSGYYALLPPLPNCGIASNGEICTYTLTLANCTTPGGCNQGTLGVFAESVAPQYYISTDSLALTDCGCDGNNNNKSGDPISPANGNVSYQEVDIPAQSQNSQSAFSRYYNSADPGFYDTSNPSNTDLSAGWRHSFTRQIIANAQATPYQQYFGSDSRNSSTYSTQAAACTSVGPRLARQVRSGPKQQPPTATAFAH